MLKYNKYIILVIMLFASKLSFGQQSTRLNNNWDFLKQDLGGMGFYNRELVKEDSPAVMEKQGEIILKKQVLADVAWAIRWGYKTNDGKSIKKGITFLYPLIANKSKWILPPDLRHWGNWPVAPPFLLFGAVKYNQKKWFDVSVKLDHNTQ